MKKYDFNEDWCYNQWPSVDLDGNVKSSRSKRSALTEGCIGSECGQVTEAKADDTEKDASVADAVIEAITAAKEAAEEAEETVTPEAVVDAIAGALDDETKELLCAKLCPDDEDAEDAPADESLAEGKDNDSAMTAARAKIDQFVDSLAESVDTDSEATR